jgi:hypothetical protein
LGAQAQCLSDGDVGVAASHYASKTPAPNFPALSDADGACTRAKFNALLAPAWARWWATRRA